MCGRGEIVRHVGESTDALGLAFPGTIVSAIHALDADKHGGMTCVSVWGGIQKSGRQTTRTTDAPSWELVRLNLFAEVQGWQQHVASAWICGGQSGLIFTVNGLQADAWYVFAQSADNRDAIRVSMQSDRGCSALSVRVPVRYRTIQSVFAPAWTDLPAQLTQEPFAPLETETGYYRLLAGTSTGAPIPIARESRVLRATFRSPVATLVVVTDGQGPAQSIPLPANVDVVIEPRGTLAGPASFGTLAGTEFTIELVR